MDDVEIRAKFDACRLKLLAWANPAKLGLLGHASLIQVQIQIRIANDTLPEGQRRLAPDMPITEEHLVQAYAEMTDFHVVHAELTERTAELLSEVEEVLSWIPASPLAQLECRRMIRAFIDRFFHYSLGKGWAIEYSPSVNTAILDPFHHCFQYMLDGLKRKEAEWITREEELTAQGATPGGSAHERLEWQGSTIEFVAIVKELVRAGYIDPPEHGAKKNDGNWTELVRRLQRAFQVMNTSNVEYTPEGLKNRFSGKDIAEAKEFRITLPDATRGKRKGS